MLPSNHFMHGQFKINLSNFILNLKSFANIISTIDNHNSNDEVLLKEFFMCWGFNESQLCDNRRDRLNQIHYDLLVTVQTCCKLMITTEFEGITPHLPPIVLVANTNNRWRWIATNTSASQQRSNWTISSWDVAIRITDAVTKTQSQRNSIFQVRERCPFPRPKMSRFSQSEWSEKQFVKCSWKEASQQEQCWDFGNRKNDS